MAARLLKLPEPGILAPIPNRDDDLESFWHVLLWTALKHCEHKLSLVKTQSRLQNLFDSSYTDPLAGLKAGGSNKKGELGSQSTIQEMQLGSKTLRRILTDVAKVLYTRYPISDDEEMEVAEVENIWKMVQSENPHLQESPDLEDKLDRHIYESHKALYPAFQLWQGRQRQKDVRWMENILEIALNDRTVAWDVGSANIVRRFPRKERSQKRQSGEGSNLESNNSKRQKRSGLLTVSES